MTRTATLANHDINGSVWLAWISVLVASLFFAYELIQMHMFSAINYDLMREFSLNARELGFLSSVYLWANVIFLFPAGWILDRVSTKRVILIAMSICVIGTFLFAMFSSYSTILVSRFFTGIGSAFCLLSCVRLASRWFPNSKLALVTGIIVTIAMLGGVFAQAPLTKLTEWLGWRKAVYVDGFIGVGIILLIALFIKNNPLQMDKVYENQIGELKKLGFWLSAKHAYFRKQNWLAAIYTSTMNLPIVLLGAIYGTLYLTQCYELSKTQASFINTMLFVGTIVGGPMVGWLSDRIQLRKLPMLISAVLSVVIILLLIKCDALNVSTLYVLFFLLGFFSSAQIIGYPVVSESNSPIVTASSVSVVSVVTQGGGVFYQPYFGYLLQKNWNGLYAGGIQVFSVSNYNEALFMILCGFVVAFVAALFLRETYCKQVT